MVHQLLVLGESWEVVSLGVGEDRSTVEIEVRETAVLWVGLRCPDDGEALARHGHGDSRLWRMVGRHVDEGRENKNLTKVKAGACDEWAIGSGNVDATVLGDN